VYSDKNYDAEIRVLTQLLDHADLKHAKLLEIGAGTGNHTVRLASLFGEVVALEIDRDFADLARLKTSACSNVRVQTTRVEDLDERAFDGVAAFFNVLNYISPLHIQGFLAAISARLKSGSWFVTDLWNGRAVMEAPPRRETRLKQRGSTEVSQTITPFLDIAENTVRLDYDITVTQSEKVESFTESLRMHLWRSDELTAMLNNVGLCQVQFWDRRQFPAPASDASWHVWMRAIKH